MRAIDLLSGILSGFGDFGLRLHTHYKERITIICFLQQWKMSGENLVLPAQLECVFNQIEIQGCLSDCLPSPSLTPYFFRSPSEIY